MKSIRDINPKVYKVAVVAVVVALIGISVSYFLAGFSKMNEVAYICIDADDTQDSVLSKLTPIASKRGISGFGTMMRHSGYGDNIHTGRYAIEPGETSFKVLRRLMAGMQTPLNLTIPEVRTMDRLATILSHKLMLDSATIASRLQDSLYCSRYGYTQATIPALFVPNTYEVYWDVSLDHLMERMQREHAAFWTDERLALADSIGLTPTEVATLASIIDEETNALDEKPIIAGVYLNRLRAEMPLQACPTIRFALQDFTIQRIYKKHLEVESPYNTYINLGLPPGPIKIASVGGIDAVLHHEEHNYIYMCAKEDFSGTHNFASTYEEHMANSRRYNKALKERGIK